MQQITGLKNVFQKIKILLSFVFNTTKLTQINFFLSHKKQQFH